MMRRPLVSAPGCDMRLRLVSGLIAGLLICGAALAADPPQADSALQQVYEQGQQALRENRLGDAERAFQQILAMDPRNAGAYVNLGVVAMRRKQWAIALRDLQQGERLAPGVPGVRLNIGLTNYEEGHYKAAATAFESVIRDDPASMQAHYLLAPWST